MAKKTIKEQEKQEAEEEQGLDTAELSELEAPSQADFDALQAELDAWQAKAGEYLDGWQRSRADFANYKKRVEREQELVYQNADGSIIKRYMDVLDDLERALKNRPQSGEGAAWAEGIELIYRKLSALLENEGVRAMQAEGEYFDPNLHEAITQEDNPDYESGQIIEVIKQGYLLGDRVLRPAQVRIAR
jgi:molecular chaperone GrpE